MDDKEKQRRHETFEKLCRERGLPVTSQRRLVLQTVLDLDDHPTVEAIHETVARRLPGISRTTVYRTLETLDRMGLISKACHPGRVVRYDRRTDLHHHLVCLHCDQVIDINDDRLDSLGMPDTSAFEFEVLDYSVQIRGICRHCREKEEAP